MAENRNMRARIHRMKGKSMSEFIEYCGHPVLEGFTNVYRQLEAAVKAVRPMVQEAQRTKNELIRIPIGIEITADSQQKVNARDKALHIAELRVRAFGNTLYSAIPPVMAVVEEVSTALAMQYYSKQFSEDFVADIAMVNVQAAVDLVVEALEIQENVGGIQKSLNRAGARVLKDDYESSSQARKALPTALPAVYDSSVELLIRCLRHNDSSAVQTRHYRRDDVYAVFEILKKAGWEVKLANGLSDHSYDLFVSPPAAAK
jgi:hypothetical protein